MKRRRLLLGLAGSLLAVPLVTLGAVAVQPLPEALRQSKDLPSVRVLDRRGQLLGVVRAEDGALCTPVELSRVATSLPLALKAAEDARFDYHPGIDPLAQLRALGQWVRHRRIVSGASTLTQQLARTLVPRPRTLFGKWREMVVALRIEASLCKSQILEEYLNRVDFGPNLRGAGAASHAYFAKDPGRLSLAEAATLAAMPRGPSAYDPRRRPQRLRQRRDQILDRLGRLGWVTPEQAQRARAEPLRLQGTLGLAHPHHFLRALLNGRLDRTLDHRRPVRELTTTLDASLQREVEQLASEAARRVAAFDATALSVVVLDNRLGEILAYVGAPDFFDQEHLGQNDGCLALRQPGSALKPFVYAAGMETRGYSPITPFFDVRTRFDTPTGPFVPDNYDGRFHGPVRLREALGSSLNVPAVRAISEIGVDRVLRGLREFGLVSLKRPAAEYGVGLALGDGEVRLLELAEAYLTLANEGVHSDPRAILSATTAEGQRIEPTPKMSRRIVSESTAAMLTDILSDDAARGLGFGRHGVLELPFATAAKTGTSSNHRDNWAVGYTQEVTVAVWVGNFDGRPMRPGTSGIAGAAPLFAAVLQAAMQGRTPEPLVRAGLLVPVTVCARSGALPGPGCEERVQEHVPAARTPHATCPFHALLPIDPQNGLLAGKDCKDAELRRFETYPSELLDWAHAAHRPLPPTGLSPRCPRGVEASSVPDSRVEFTEPHANSQFLLDEARDPSVQRLRFAVRVGANVAWVRYQVGSEISPPVPAPYHWYWSLRRGRHQVTVTTSTGQRATQRFEVQ